MVRARAANGPVAPGELMRALGRVRSRPALHHAIREMVDNGELAYTLEHGRTLLELSFDRPMRVSGRITLAPPGRESPLPAGGVLVRLAPGAAFGAGRHPTTRLALRGVDRALERGRAGGRVLDVGTGTGVLAIAAVALGMRSGLGLDLDPCALSEARENVRLNGMEGRIRISEAPVETVTGAFELVAANLRPPTLARLAGTLRERVQVGGALVVSGMRVEERADVAAALQSGGRLQSVWVEEEAGWAAVLLERE
jgi:ribosomal protein L11 methyltransferase